MYVQGTPAYASVNAHLGYTPSTSSELEVATVVLLHVLGVCMPWLEPTNQLAMSSMSEVKQEPLYALLKMAWLLGKPVMRTQVSQGRAAACVKCMHQQQTWEKEAAVASICGQFAALLLLGC